MITIRVTMVGNNLTSVDDLKVGGNDLIFVKVLFMLDKDICFISGILLVKFCKMSSVWLEMFRDCFRAKAINFGVRYIKNLIYFLGLPWWSLH